MARLSPVIHVRPDGHSMAAERANGVVASTSWPACARKQVDVPVTAVFETGDAVASMRRRCSNSGRRSHRHGFSRTTASSALLLGSVTDDVLRKAGCPVLVVPPHADTASRRPFTHLLCPVDFSPASRTGLALAYFCIAPGGRCSIDPGACARKYATRNDLITSGPFAYPECRAQRERDAHIALKCLIPPDLKTSRPPVTLVAIGNPYREILRIAAEQSVDLIVSGVHGRNPWDLLIFGSTTNQVIRRATCPVLSVRL